MTVTFRCGLGSSAKTKTWRLILVTSTTWPITARSAYYSRHTVPWDSFGNQGGGPPPPPPPPPRVLLSHRHRNNNNNQQSSYTFPAFLSCSATKLFLWLHLTIAILPVGGEREIRPGPHSAQSRLFNRRHETGHGSESLARVSFTFFFLPFKSLHTAKESDQAGSLANSPPPTHDGRRMCFTRTLGHSPSERINR